MTSAGAALLRSLGQHVRLDEADERAVLSLPATVVSLGPREEIVREGEKPRSVSLLLNGFACRTKSLSDGRRQNLCFFVPGDVCDHGSALAARMDHTVETLTAVTVASIPQAALDEVIVRHPRIARGLSFAQLVESAIARELLLSLGQRTALERTAHLFCELFWRLRAVGLTRGDTCEAPFTQMVLGDMLGLSAVHVNRTLQELRRQNLIVLRERELAFPDLEALEAVAVFDPAYLHLDDAAEPGPGLRRRG